jgi:hypothetical protein
VQVNRRAAVADVSAGAATAHPRRFRAGARREQHREADNDPQGAH